MSYAPMERALVLCFRLAMAWTFLYAASNQVFSPGWSVVPFVKTIKTFHDLFAIFATPTVGKITTYLVAYGHLLIGLSLLTGLLVRLSAAFGTLLMVIYWMAHMNWPYISDRNNFILDFHLVYAGVLIYLIIKRAGHIWGLDGWVENLQMVKNHPALHRLVV